MSRCGDRLYTERYSFEDFERRHRDYQHPVYYEDQPQYWPSRTLRREEGRRRLYPERVEVPDNWSRIQRGYSNDLDWDSRSYRYESFCPAPRELRRAPYNRGRLHGEEMECSWSREREDERRREQELWKEKSKSSRSKSRSTRAKQSARRRRAAVLSLRGCSPLSSRVSSSSSRRPLPVPIAGVLTDSDFMSQLSPVSDESESEATQGRVPNSSDSGAESGFYEQSSPVKVKTEYLETDECNEYQIKQEPCLVKSEDVNIVKLEKIEVKREGPVLQKESGTNASLFVPVRAESRILYEQLLVPVRDDVSIPKIGGENAAALPQIISAPTVAATDFESVPQSTAGPPADMAAVPSPALLSSSPSTSEVHSSLHITSTDPQRIPVVVTSDLPEEPFNCFDQRQSVSKHFTPDKLVSDFFEEIPDGFFARQKLSVTPAMWKAGRERVLINTNPRVRATTNRKNRPRHLPSILKKPWPLHPVNAAANLGGATLPISAIDRFLRGEDKNTDLHMFNLINVDKTAMYLR